MKHKHSRSWLYSARIWIIFICIVVLLLLSLLLPMVFFG